MNTTDTILELLTRLLEVVTSGFAVGVAIAEYRKHQTNTPRHRVTTRRSGARHLAR